jgi:hypothetical protein
VFDYILDDQGSIPSNGKGFFIYPLCPHQLRGPPSLIFNRYCGSIPGGNARPRHDAILPLPLGSCMAVAGPLLFYYKHDHMLNADLTSYQKNVNHDIKASTEILSSIYSFYSIQELLQLKLLKYC